MRSLRIEDGRIWSGHFIFIRDARSLSDVKFLEVLKLRGYKPDSEPCFPLRYAHIMRASDWSGFADDWYYTAYNSGVIADAVSRLACNYEVLRLAIGDADQSFEFYHFVDGKLHRGFHFHDYAGKSSVMLDSGSPLKCECAFELGSDPWPFLCAVTEELGIDCHAMAKDVSSYSRSYKRRWQLFTK
jgi:hypothetical protein